MRRWVPFPRMSVCLLVLWLLLNQSLAPAQLLLGALLAVVIPRTVPALLPGERGPRRPRAALRLLGLVLMDILRSNVAVARLIAYRGQRRATAAFLFIPLKLRNANGLALLACIVTSTPGTLWVDYDLDDSILMMHVLDLIDESAWIHLIKNRYEPLLLEVFE